MTLLQQELSIAAQILNHVQRVACLTGAGVSAESGVDTFRDAETGLWSKFDPVQLASQEGFAADPGFVWRWYMERLAHMSTVPPNAGHVALAQLASIAPDFTLATQNIDDLHERGGSEDVLHLHGSINRFRCNDCQAPYALTAGDRIADEPPACPRCGGLIRPCVVWFGEMLPDEALAEAQRAARSCDVMLVVGTSGVVYPAASLPFTAAANGATIIEVNPVQTDITEVADIALRAPSGIVLPQLIAEMRRSNRYSDAGSHTN